MKISEKIANRIGVATAAASATLVSTVPGFCAMDLSGVTVDTTDYLAIATFLITALVAFWGVKKGLRLLG